MARLIREMNETKTDYDEEADVLLAGASTSPG